MSIYDINLGQTEFNSLFFKIIKKKNLNASHLLTMTKANLEISTTQCGGYEKASIPFSM